MNNMEDNQPWYCQFWPWFLITIPLLTVIAGIAMIFISLDEPDSVVIDDYYKEGLAINRNLQRDHIAQQLKLTARLDIDLEQQTLSMTLNGKIQDSQSDLSVLFSHPTKSKKDRLIKLTSTDQKTYKGKISDVEAGRWYLLIEPGSKLWRLKGEIHLQEVGSYKL